MFKVTVPDPSAPINAFLKGLQMGGQAALVPSRKHLLEAQARQQQIRAQNYLKALAIQQQRANIAQQSLKPPQQRLYEYLYGPGAGAAGAVSPTPTPSGPTPPVSSMPAQTATIPSVSPVTPPPVGAQPPAYLIPRMVDQAITPSFTGTPIQSGTQLPSQISIPSGPSSPLNGLVSPPTPTPSPVAQIPTALAEARRAQQAKTRELEARSKYYDYRGSPESRGSVAQRDMFYASLPLDSPLWGNMAMPDRIKMKQSATGAAITRSTTTLTKNVKASMGSFNNAFNATVKSMDDAKKALGGVSGLPAWEKITVGNLVERFGGDSKVSNSMRNLYTHFDTLAAELRILLRTNSTDTQLQHAYALATSDITKMSWEGANERMGEIGSLMKSFEENLGRASTIQNLMRALPNATQLNLPSQHFTPKSSPQSEKIMVKGSDGSMYMMPSSHAHLVG